MAKLTVLQFVQRALSAINSDNVTSISDSGVEAEQVKLMLDAGYEELLNDFPWDHLIEYGTLEVTATAHVMRLPDDVRTFSNSAGTLTYNDSQVNYITPERMNQILKGRDTSFDNVDANGALDDVDPVYWTTEDDEYIIFDSYDGSLVANKSRVRFVKQPIVLSNDTDIPDLPEVLHITLLHKLFEDAFRLLKGDDANAQVYSIKYRKSLAKAKRWAKRFYKKDSTFGPDYARRNVSFRREISTRNIIEGS